MHRGFLIISLLFVSLVSDAKISLPDSLQTITKAYTYFITSPDTAKAILDVVREPFFFLLHFWQKCHFLT